MRNSFVITLLLLCIVTLAAFLRIHNLSPFKIYPDSYQSLLVAQNIIEYQGVLGYLGNQGILYPQFFSWTRPGYPLLILLVNFLTHDLALAAHIVAMSASILAIIGVFFLVKNIFRSYTYGLAGAFLLAISFQHTVWSGFIMTEALGVLFMSFFLWRLFSRIKKTSQWLSIFDLLTGLLFGAAVLTRYEYIVILVPLIFLVWFISPKPFIRLINILLAFVSLIALCFFTLFPIVSTFAIIGKQISDLLLKIAIAIIAGSIAFYFMKKYWRTVSPFLKKSLLISVIIFPLLSFLLPDLFLFRNFTIHDPLLGILIVIGFITLLQKKQYNSYTYFIAACSIFLGIIYQHVNAEMDRYLTHLLPFLIIPASYGFITLLQKKRPFLFMILLLPIILFQIFHSYQGLRYLQEDAWYQLSYEEQTADKMQRYLKKGKPFIIASEPEPYFLTLQLSTQSITDTYPYIVFSAVPKNQRILIIQDMGMHAYFPHFSHFLNTHMQDKTKATFWVKEKYLIAAEAKKETSPVILYEITLQDLEQRIKKEK